MITQRFEKEELNIDNLIISNKVVGLFICIHSNRY